MVKWEKKTNTLNGIERGLGRLKKRKRKTGLGRFTDLKRVDDKREGVVK